MPLAGRYIHISLVWGNEDYLIKITIWQVSFCIARWTARNGFLRPASYWSSSFLSVMQLMGIPQANKSYILSSFSSEIWAGPLYSRQSFITHFPLSSSKKRKVTDILKKTSPHKLQFLKANKNASNLLNFYICKNWYHLIFKFHSSWTHKYWSHDMKKIP